MDILLDVAGHVVVDNVLHVGNVQASSRHSSSNYSKDIFYSIFKVCQKSAEQPISNAKKNFFEQKNFRVNQRDRWKVASFYDYKLVVTEELTKLVLSKMK